MSNEALSNPVINSPYEEPTRHFVIGPNGPTGELGQGRRPSEFFIPVPKPKKGRASKAQDALFDGLEVTGEKITRNDAIDQLRQEVGIWRQRQYQRVSPISRKLLNHWADPERENRILFAQREAAETAIFLAEVVGRRDYTPSLSGVDWRDIPDRGQRRAQRGPAAGSSEARHWDGQDRRNGHAHRVADAQQDR